MKFLLHIFFIIFLIANSFIGCAKKTIADLNNDNFVNVIVVAEKEMQDNVSCFGAVAFSKKLDVSSSQDGCVDLFSCKEGDLLKKGDCIALLKNEQLNLAYGRAQNTLTQAEASLAVIDARLFEARLLAETKLLGIEKANIELRKLKREFSEIERKLADQEKLFEIGAIAEEAIRDMRSSSLSFHERILMMEHDIAMTCIGFRDEDLIARGLLSSERNYSDADKKELLIYLATLTLESEKKAAAAMVEVAKKELTSTSVSMSELRINSPIDGIISAKYFENGELIKRGEKLLTIIDTSSLHVITSINEADAVKLKKGTKAIINIDAIDTTLNGFVDNISPMADAKSASVSVRVTINNPPPNLKPGMFSRLSFLVGGVKKVIAIPDSSLFEKKDNSAKLFITSGSVIHKKEVGVVGSLPGGYVIISGISSGDVIVDRPSIALRDGQNVEVLH